MLTSVTSAACMSPVSLWGGFLNTPAHDEAQPATLAASGAVGHLSDAHVHMQPCSTIREWQSHNVSFCYHVACVPASSAMFAGGPGGHLADVRRRRAGRHRGPALGRQRAAALEPRQELGGQRRHVSGRVQSCCCFNSAPHHLVSRPSTKSTCLFETTCRALWTACVFPWWPFFGNLRQMMSRLCFYHIYAVLFVSKVCMD